MWFWLEKSISLHRDEANLQIRISLSYAQIYSLYVYMIMVIVSRSFVCVCVIWITITHSECYVLNDFEQIVQSLVCIIQIRSDRLDNCIMPPVLDEKVFNHSISHMLTLHPFSYLSINFMLPLPSLPLCIFFIRCAIHMKCSMCVT